MNDAELVKRSLKSLAKAIGELIGEWEISEGFEVTQLSLTGNGVYIISAHPDGVILGGSEHHVYLCPQRVIER